MDNEMEFDGTQCAALEAMVPHAAVSVVGMSGSGKTSLLIEKVARILEADTSTRVAVLSPDRRRHGATQRDHLARGRGRGKPRGEIGLCVRFRYRVHIRPGRGAA